MFLPKEIWDRILTFLPLALKNGELSCSSPQYARSAVLSSQLPRELQPSVRLALTLGKEGVDYKMSMQGQEGA